MSIILKTCEEKVSGLQMGAPPHFETASRPKSHFRHANLSTFGQVHAETRPTGKQRVRVQGLCKINCEMNNDSTDAEIRAPSNWDMHGCVSMFMPRMHSTCARYTAGPAESQRKGSSEMRRWEEEAVRIREGCEPCDGVAYSSSDQGGIPRLAIDHSDQYDQRAFVIICGSYYLGGNSPEQFLTH
jgi:hypothetical protein